LEENEDEDQSEQISKLKHRRNCSDHILIGKK